MPSSGRRGRGALEAKLRGAALLAAVAVFAGLVLLLVERPRVDREPASRAAEGDTEGSDAPPRGAADLLAGDARRSTPGPPGSRGNQAGALALGRGDAGLEIEIRDAAGLPVPGTLVVLRARRSAGAGSVGPSEPTEDALAAGDGVAVFQRLAKGDYALRLRAPDGATFEVPEALHLEAGEQRRLTLRVGRSDRTLAGRVLTATGEPIIGVEVVASVQRRPSVGDEITIAPQGEQRVQTDASGRFAFVGLGDEDYRIRTAPTRRHGEAQAVVRAGASAVDLVVQETRALRVRGTVRDTRGDPIAGVAVAAEGTDDASTLTRDDGSYALDLQVDGSRSRFVTFRAAGYATARRKLPEPAASDPDAARIDVALAESSGTARVSGVLRTPSGEPVANERVQLFSPDRALRYAATSNARGEFSFPAVEIRSDYEVAILPQSGHRDYAARPIEVPRDGLSLDVTLEPLAVGPVAGRIVDAEGRPIPGFVLWLRGAAARRQRLRVTSGGDGRFAVDEAPAGGLVFETRSSPQLQVTGLENLPGGAEELVVVLDWGDHEFAGRVLDAQGTPVAGARLKLSWNQQSGGARSTSTRTAVSSAAGAFRFTRLGPGRHFLSAERPGIGTAVQTIKVSQETGEITVRLKLRRVSPDPRSG